MKKRTQGQLHKVTAILLAAALVMTSVPAERFVFASENGDSSTAGAISASALISATDYTSLENGKVISVPDTSYSPLLGGFFYSTDKRKLYDPEEDKTVSLDKLFEAPGLGSVSGVATPFIEDGYLAVKKLFSLFYYDPVNNTWNKMRPACAKQVYVPLPSEKTEADDVTGEEADPLSDVLAKLEEGEDAEDADTGYDDMDEEDEADDADYEDDEEDADSEADEDADDEDLYEDDQDEDLSDEDAGEDLAEDETDTEEAEDSEKEKNKDPEKEVLDSLMQEESAKHEYVFEISTGENDGRNITFLKLCYNGNRSVYLFPRKGDFKRGFLAADKEERILSEIADYESYTDVHLQDPYQMDSRGLRKNATDQVLFETRDAIESLDGVLCYAKYEDKPCQWNLTGMKLYRVDSLSGIAMRGGYSDSFFIDFEGELLAKADFKNESPNMGCQFQWERERCFRILPAETEKPGKFSKLKNKKENDTVEKTMEPGTEDDRDVEENDSEDADPTEDGSGLKKILPGFGKDGRNSNADVSGEEDSDAEEEEDYDEEDEDTEDEDLDDEEEDDDSYDEEEDDDSYDEEDEDAEDEDTEDEVEDEEDTDDGEDDDLDAGLKWGATINPVKGSFTGISGMQTQTGSEDPSVSGDQVQPDAPQRLGKTFDVNDALDSRTQMDEGYGSEDATSGFDSSTYREDTGDADTEEATEGTDEAEDGSTAKEEEQKEKSVLLVYKPENRVSLMTEGISDSVKLYAPGKNDVYGFRIHFADQPGGGLENLSYRGKRSLKEGEYIESIALRVEYTDRFGKQMSICLPAVTNSLKWAVDKGIGQQPVACVAQAGQELYFEGEIPEFSELRQICLVNGSETVAKACGLSLREDATPLMLERRQESNEEEASLSRLAVYHLEEGVNIKPEMEGSMISYDYQGLPRFYRKSETEFGLQIAASAMTGIQMLRPNKNFDFSPVGWGTRKYLIGITTDKDQSAGTLSQLNMQLSYVNTLGQQTKSPIYSLAEESEAFYGVWKQDQAEDGQFGYLAGVSPGNTLYFTVSIPDADYFTAADFYLKEGNDEWKGSGIQIWALDQLSGFQGDWSGVSVTNGDRALNSDIRFYRQFQGINMLNIDDSKAAGKEQETAPEAAMEQADVSETSLLQEGVRVAANHPDGFSFVSKNIREVEEEEVVSIRDEITYADSLQDFGFAKSRKNYEVKVKVRDKDPGMNVDTDCGSDSDFYFQLVFENGTSGVVLANHQLEGDRFRSGNTECFTIGTNKDFGKLIAVRIIPQERREDEPEDKLCIDQIRVTEQSQAPYTDTWIIDNIPDDGWISERIVKNKRQHEISLGTDQEENEASRKAAIELPVQKSANELDFLVCLATGEYGGNASQFKGTMTMRVDYIDTFGEPAYREFDIVDAMYRYYEKEPAQISSGEKNGAVDTVKKVVSDEKYMFRGEHTDRFIISLENVRSIYQATLIGESMNENCRLPVCALSFQVLEQDGGLKLSSNGEYVHLSQARLLTSDMNLLTGQEDDAMVFTPGKEQQKVIDLKANELAMRNDGSKYLSVHSEDPESTDDRLNIYVYPTADSPDLDSWDLSCRVDYSDICGNHFSVSGQAKDEVMQRHKGSGEDEGDYFYAESVSANSIGVLDMLYLKNANESETAGKIDHALIRQMRGDTVVRTCYLDGYEMGIAGILGLRPGKKTYVGITDRQEVTLQLSADTAPATLLAKEADLGVSFTYRSPMDPSGEQLRSAVRYLTDEEIYQIRAGKVVTLTFKEPYVSEITSLRIVNPDGSLSGSVEKAYAVNYHVSSEDDTARTEDGWYSFGSGASFSPEGSDMQQTGRESSSDKTVAPLSITFRTAAPKATEESGINAPISMTLGYEDAYGHESTLKVNDIRTYITDEEDQNFDAGSEKTILLLAEGVSRITYMELNPAASNTGYDEGWNLESVSAKVGRSGAVSRRLTERIEAGKTKHISFNTVKLTVKATYPSRTQNTNETKEVENENADFIIASGKSVTFRTELTGSSKGVNTLVEKRVGSSMQTESSLLTKKSSSSDKVAEFEFTPPKNDTLSDVVYRITFKSAENEEACCVFTVTVLAEPASTTSTDSGSSSSSGQSGSQNQYRTEDGSGGDEQQIFYLPDEE
ncbi:MAG: hypothetical protein K5739_02800 [Lachnospiraceae bacterium]|nr:hypothetical protein [Lachnospiraceae bacterium]